MSTLVWTGGGNNRANNPADWTDQATGQHRVPAPGDTLSNNHDLGSPSTSVMNIQGNDLAGNSLGIGGPTGFTANLSHLAHVTAGVGWGAGTFNVTQGSYLDVTAQHAGITVNLNNSNLAANPAYGVITVNASGVDTISMRPSGGPGWASINLAPGTILQGMVQNSVALHGAPGSMFVNNGNSSASVVDVSVFGHGTWTVKGSMEFGGYVGPQQTVEDYATVTIDQPHQFGGQVNLDASPSQIFLKAVGHVDSYSYKNDILSLYRGNTVVDTLRLHTAVAPSGGYPPVDVMQGGSGSGDPDVWIRTDPGSAGIHPTDMLPQHSLA